MIKGDVFKKENSTYWFYSMLPILLWLELLLLYLLVDKHAGMVGFLGFAGVICFVTGIVLGLLHFCKSISFRERLNSLTDQQKHSLNEEAIVKLWKVLLSREVLIEYGMFTRRVILVEDILSVRRHKDTLKISAGAYRVSQEVDNMILTMKDGRTIVVGENSNEMMEALNRLLAGKEVKKASIEQINSVGEKPVEGITALAIVGSICLTMGSYLHIMELFFHGHTDVEKVLFFLGYEGYFWLGAVLIMAACVMGVFVWRGLALRGKRRGAMGTLWRALVFLPILFIWAEYDNKFNEYTQAAKADYQLYQEGVYEQAMVNNMEKTAAPYEAWGEWSVYDYMESLGIQYEFVKIDKDAELSYKGEYFPEFILIDSENYSRDAENGREIQYLKNTGIVVDIR